MARDWYTLGLLAATLTVTVAATGCSGKSVDSAEAADAAPVPVRPVKAVRKVKTDSSAAVTDSTASANEMEVMRESFAYQGGARDPFNSLVTGLSIGPELVDLQLVGVYLDMGTPSNSVIVLRQKKDGKRFKMQAGDRLGRIRLAQIRTAEAVFMIQDLGTERQETLSLRKQEDATP